MTAATDEHSQSWSEFLERNDHLIREVVAWRKWFFPVHVQEDIAQQVRFELVRRHPPEDEIRDEKSFIKLICIRRCIGEVRRDRRDRERLIPITSEDDDGHFRDNDLLATDPEFDPLLEIERQERALMLRRLLERVGEPCQTRLREFYTDGLSQKEIAQLHEISITTVGTRVFRCIKKLRTLANADAESKEYFSSTHDREGRRPEI